MTSAGSDVSSGSPRVAPNSDDPYFSRLISGSKVTWTATTLGALLSLVLLWVFQLYTTWGAWGNLTIDSGHEMYVPALLAGGKLLYRDVWFMYGPAAPYFNSYLFRLFGAKLIVLYWAGSLSALGAAVFLYLTGMRLSSWLVGWTAGAVVLLEGFQPSLFCFPLPYSFAAVYACLLGCIFLWLIVCLCSSTRWAWILSAATVAAVELLLKPEFGTACYLTLALFIMARSFLLRAWRLLARDVLLALPGIVICSLVIRWMVSIRGVEFITQENIVSWPTSYFMKTFGKMWLAQNGFTLTVPAFRDALLLTIPLALTALFSYLMLWRKLSDRRTRQLKLLLIVILVLYVVLMPHFMEGQFSFFGVNGMMEQTLSLVFFPQNMVLYVIVACFAAWAYLWRRRDTIDARIPAILFVLTFSTLLAFRILMNMSPGDYPIFYNGPVVLSFLMLACWIIPRTARSRRFAFVGELIICLGCLATVALHARAREAETRNFVPLVTDRGTVRVSKQLAEGYSAAIQFMKEKASVGQTVLSVPEDTSLYFLSGTYCPTRVFSFTPGVLAPGSMTNEMIREIEEKPVDYLLWSNRTFPEFGVPVFGIDFDLEIGDYLKSNYRPVSPLVPRVDSDRGWSSVIWERKPETKIE